MSISINQFTGNSIVDEVGQMHFSGNVIPETWYQTITDEKGKVQMPAILILSEIVYWYRPSEIRNEEDGSTIFKKRFHDDYLQLSYERISAKFNISKRNAKDYVVFLEKLGVIKRHLKNITSSCGVIPNVLYIELMPDRLKELTYPENSSPVSDTSAIRDISIEKTRDVSLESVTSVSKTGETNTNNTTQTTTKITSSTSPAPEIDDVDAQMMDLGLTHKDINCVHHAAGNDIEKCKRALDALMLQKNPISNLTGWLITAVTNDYSPIKHVPVNRRTGNSFMPFPQRKPNPFNSYPQRTDYDFDALERQLISNQCANS